MSSRLLAAGLCVLFGCSSGAPTQPVPEVVASVVVTPGTDTAVALGQTRQFVAVARNASGATVTGKTFAWQSSAPTVVSVNPATGLATALARGEATITASVDGKFGLASLLVAQVVSTVEVSPGTAGLTVIGANQQFSAVAKDASGAVVVGVQFLWVSSDPTIATVDNSGKATAKAPGSITVTAAGLGVPGSATLTVTQVATQLVITAQPSGATEGLQFPGVVQVEIRDANGALVVGARNTVSLTIGTNPAGGTLSGTTVVNAVGGVATFSGLALSQAGTGYTLAAASAGLTGVTTAAMNVFLNFVGVGAGGATTCGLTAFGAVYCWGQNANGQLGDGTTTSRSLPTKVLAPAGVRFTAISQNTRDASPLVTNCARSDGGAAYCWGSGVTGGIGDGLLVNRLTATLVTPPAGVSFAMVTAGGTHACGGAPSGAAYCWGNGVRGNLGDGTGANHPLPTLVTPPAGVSFATLSAGMSINCGTTSIGAAYCWGNNSSGQIGDGFTADRLIPTLVAAPGGVSFATVQAGGGVSCGLTFTGAVYCWGSGFDGQVGDGTNSNRLTPVPIAAPVGVTFGQITTSVFHTCGLSTTGQAYCWGFNGSVQLGDGTSTSRNTPTAVIMPAGVSFISISAGNDHTCGITSLGAMYCWGSNTVGQLGDGTSGTTRATPVRVQR